LRLLLRAVDGTVGGDPVKPPPTDRVPIVSYGQRTPIGRSGNESDGHSDEARWVCGITVSGLALPLLALMVLHASTFEADLQLSRR
jgi:hypothetical protein